MVLKSLPQTLEKVRGGGTVYLQIKGYKKP